MVFGREKAQLIAKVALEKKAERVVILGMRGLAGWTDYFVISSGSSSRQVKAIADEIMEKLSHSKTQVPSVEGYHQGEWVLIDAGDVVAHIFMPEQRSFYDLERLWGDAPRIIPPPVSRPGGAQ